MSEPYDRFTLPKAAFVRKNGRIELGMPERPTRAQCSARWEATRRLVREDEEQRTVPRPDSARHAPLYTYRQGVAQQAEAQELAQVRAVNRCQGQQHNWTSEAHPLLPVDSTTVNESFHLFNNHCTQRYQGRVQAEARAHQADHAINEKQQTQRMQLHETLRHGQDSLELSLKLADQYPHGLPRGMIRRLSMQQNLITTPCSLGFGQ